MLPKNLPGFRYSETVRHCGALNRGHGSGYRAPDARWLTEMLVPSRRRLARRRLRGYWLLDS